MDKERILHSIILFWNTYTNEKHTKGIILADVSHILLVNIHSQKIPKLPNDWDQDNYLFREH